MFTDRVSVQPVFTRLVRVITLLASHLPHHPYQFHPYRSWVQTGLPRYKLDYNTLYIVACRTTILAVRCSSPFFVNKLRTLQNILWSPQIKRFSMYVINTYFTTGITLIHTHIDFLTLSATFRWFFRSQIRAKLWRYNPQAWKINQLLQNINRITLYSDNIGS